ncbi:MAG: hypothetical protein U0132_19510 [Gemmatimonadaceae bacterium]
MRRNLRPAVRFLFAVVAATVALGPGLAAIVDAKPAARAVAQRFASHAEETGRKHDLRAHVDDCTLCQLATRGATERPTSVPLVATAAPASLPRWRAPHPHANAERWTARSRGPPTV